MRPPYHGEKPGRIRRTISKYMYHYVCSKWNAAAIPPHPWPPLTKFSYPYKCVVHRMTTAIGSEGQAALTGNDGLPPLLFPLSPIPLERR